MSSLPDQSLLRTRLRRGLVSVIAALATVVFATNVNAYELEPYHLAGAATTFKVHPTMDQRMDNLTLGTGEAYYWAQTAASRWVERTGIPFDFKFGGSALATSCENHTDDDNSISAMATTNGSALATTVTVWNSGTGEVVEWDMCFWGEATNWEVVASDMATNETDFLGVLVHEFGHVIGMAHSAGGSTMSGANHTGNINRHLFGDDIRGARDHYSSEGLVSLTRYWRTWDWNADEWGARHSISGAWNFRPVRAAIGANSSGTSYVVAASLQQGSDVPQTTTFSRATNSLTSSSTWSSNSYSTPSWQSPAIASNHDSQDGEFLAAVPLNTNDLTSGCGPLKVFKSTNAFSSATTYSLSDMCTFDAPAIAWNEDRGRWIMVWVDIDFSVEENTNRMMYRSSTDGTNWTSPAVLGRYSLETPGLACREGNGGECLLTYVRASDTSPNVVARKVTFNSSGVISLGSFTEYANGLQREVSPAYSWFTDWHMAYGWTNSGNWRSKGWSTFRSVHDDGIPPNNSASLVGESAEHPPNLAGNEEYANTYLFYTD